MRRWWRATAGLRKAWRLVGWGGRNSKVEREGESPSLSSRGGVQVCESPFSNHESSARGDHRGRLSLVFPCRIKVEIDDREYRGNVKFHYPYHHHHHRPLGHPCHPLRRCQSNFRRSHYRILRLRRSLLPRAVNRPLIPPLRIWSDYLSGVTSWRLLRD